MKDGKPKLPFGYEAGWQGVARACLWCLFFLVVAGGLAPHPAEEIPFTKAAAGTPVVPMVTIADDHRLIREDVKRDPEKLDILWISDSSGVLIAADKDFVTAGEDDTRILPAFVARDLQDRYGLKNFTIHFYAQLGMHPVDKLIFTLEALRRKPDLIVMPINPFYDFSHYKVMGQNAPLQLAPRAFADRPALWPLGLAIVSPSNGLLTLAGDRLRVICEAGPIKREVERNLLSRFSLLTHGNAGEEAKFDSPLNNVGFWIAYELLGGDVSRITGRDGKPSQQMLNQRVMESGSPLLRHSLATESTRRVMDYLRQSGIPALLYTMPLGDPYYLSPSSANALGNIRDYLRAENRAHEKGTLRLIPEIPANIRRTITFRPGDNTHITEPGAFDDYLARQIWQEIGKYRLQKTEEK
ncbi:MAG: hypothetical protein GC185_13800 [Alphaproteobacteria bacterium]|nr:hypothetical protein [Alphaproteobacteria bacterium]